LTTNPKSYRFPKIFLDVVVGGGVFGKVFGHTTKVVEKKGRDEQEKRNA
jgi:hypothetical protein